MDYLPLDVHIEIVRYLPLRDALAYSQVCTVAFDAVYYVFAHGDRLDFSLLDENNVIALPDEILGILHAHTHASVINFCLPHTFTLFTDLDQYFSLYWSKHTNNDFTAAVVVGHPMGTLQQIYYINYHGLPYNTSSESKALLWSLWQKYEPYSENLSYIDSYSRPGKPWPNTSLYNNWSTANIEIPYHCTTCNSLTAYEGDICAECSPDDFC